VWRNQAQPIASLVKCQIGVGNAGHESDALRLLLLNVHLHSLQFEEAGQPLDVVAEEVPADVIGVVVGGERSHQLHAVAFRGPHQAFDIPRRIHDHRLPTRAIPDEVAEVDHLSGNRIGAGEVPSGEQLAKVEVLVVVHGIRRIAPMLDYGDNSKKEHVRNETAKPRAVLVWLGVTSCGPAS
jgi:hypothetical protein